MPFGNAGEQDILDKYLTNGPTRWFGLLNMQFTAVASTDTFTTTAAHGLSVGDDVYLGPIQTSATVASTAAAPTIAGLTQLLPYFVKTVPSATTFTLSTTSGGTTVDVTADCYGGWMSETKGSMTATGVVEAANAGYGRISQPGTDWTNSGLVNGDALYTGASKSFGPAQTQAFQYTHSFISTTQTGGGVLLLATPSALIGTVAVGNTTQVQPKITVS